jgi:hypothetical protein
MAAAAIAVVLSLSLFLLLPIGYKYNIAPFALAQKQQQQRIFGVGAGILPNDVPTLFSFVASRNGEQSKEEVSGHFECFAVMPDGKTMYVNGTVTGLTLASTSIPLTPTNGTSVTLSGPTIVTGFGAGAGTFKAVAIMQEATGSTIIKNGKLVLTTDVNGDGIQGNIPDGSEGPFNEQIMKGSIKISP